MDPTLTDASEIPVEEVPDEDKLFLALHRTFGTTMSPSHFKPQAKPGAPIGLSCDWDKYRTAEQCRDARRIPADNGVGALVAGDVRRQCACTVSHTPEVTNKGHCEIGHDKIGDVEVRVKLCRIATEVIPIEIKQQLR